MTPRRVGALLASVALVSAPAALVGAVPVRADASASGALSAASVKSSPFTIGLSADTVKAGSTVTISGLAYARAGTPLMIMSDAISSTRLVGGVPTVQTPAFVEGTYRTSILVPPATMPATYPIVVKVNGKQVAATSIKVLARGGSGGHPSTRTGCAAIGFTVLHNDQSGGVILPAGLYKVSSPNLACSTASADFATFLSRYNGAIPGWSATAAGAGRGTYTQRTTGNKFTVARTR